MSEFNWGRPLYRSNNASLVDIISENVYLGSKEIKNNITHAVSNTYNSVVDFYKNDKNALPFTIGTVASITFNYVATHYAAHSGYDSSLVKWWSFGGESAVNTLFATGTYFTKAVIKGKREGNIKRELWGTTKDLSKLVLITAPMSFGPYRIAKNLGSDLFIDIGLPSSFTLPMMQTMLLYPFVRSIEYTQDAIKYVGDNVAYFRTNPGSLKKSMLNRKDLIGLKLSVITENVTDTSSMMFETAKERGAFFIKSVKDKMRA